MVFRESDTRTERALVLNAFIMCLVPAGMSCRHKSLETVVSWELVSSDRLMASFSHCSLQKSVRPGVFGWSPGEFAKDRTHKRLIINNIFMRNIENL